MENFNYEAQAYFYVEDISGSTNTLTINKSNLSAPSIMVYKSTNMRDWTLIGFTDTTAITATIPANGKLYLKAIANKWGKSLNDYNYINCSGNHNVGGNIMSLLYGDNFINKISFISGSEYNFSSLFYTDTTLISAAHLILPATTLNYCCYNSMFRGCKSLTTPPELPATTLANYCYQKMFSDCNALTTAPGLTATTLTNGCYEYMFECCKSLTTAPELPATTLHDRCYSYMFDNCSALTTAPALPATTLANSCYSYMFDNCFALTYAPILPATTLIDYCYQGMFMNCTSLITAPELPATTLAIHCYDSMFRFCTSLTRTPDLPATTLYEYCYKEMFRGCGNLNTAITYASDISAYNCLNHWLDSVSATGDFYNYGGATYIIGGSGIPSGWIEHQQATDYYVNISAGSNGSVSVNGIPGDYSDTVPYGTILTLSTTPSVGYKFNGWSDGNTENPRIITVKSDITLTASFEELHGVYFYVEDISGSDNTMSIQKNDPRAPTIEVFKSTDMVTWTSMGSTSKTEALTATVPANSKLYLKATAIKWGDNVDRGNTITCTSGQYNVGGSIMSLLCGDDFEGATITTDNAFNILLRECEDLINAGDLALPSNVNYRCYYGMFSNCEGLITAPELPATTLDEECYRAMFENCYALTTAPSLPAEVLAQGCYLDMFRGCENLTKVETYAEDISALECLDHWMDGVSPTGDFYNYGDATYTTGGSGIPSGWVEHK